MKVVILVLSLVFPVLSVIADEKVVNLDPVFGLSQSARFYYVGSEGNQTLRGELLVAGKGSTQFPDVCEHEGGDAQLHDAYTVSAGNTFFVFTCSWVVLHPGVNLKGTDFVSYVYSDKEIRSLVNDKKLASSISGYEGSLEEGGGDYFWYSTRALASKKLKETARGARQDSLELSHDIVLVRLKDKDYEALKYYLTQERLDSLLREAPVSRVNSGIYNDFGFALGEAGSNKVAYSLLSKVEAVSPERVVLKLNIADVLWSSDEVKSKQYYQSYIAMMKGQGKEHLIPSRAIERVK
ncbi:hypothetical protein [Pseudomonas koreensis]|uniref:hypothetical protein n=2 Tax=Pseudomonas TaxID=286 RepID=UPI00225BAD50|nr:hypothetical protein [Pseudomonas koreensis]UZT92845.1 hypothetical protein OPS05_27840 [Pseudomonas koreensis]